MDSNTRSKADSIRQSEGPVQTMPTISVEEAPSHSFPFSPNSSVTRKENKEEDKKSFIVAKEQEEAQTVNQSSTNSTSQIRQENEHSPVIKRRMTIPACTNTLFLRTLSEEAKMEEFKAIELENRLKSLIAAFSARTKRTKAKIKEPPTPSTTDSETEESIGGEANLLDRLKLLCSPGGSQFGEETRRKSISQKVKGSFIRQLKLLVNILKCNYTLDADGSFYVGWLVIVSACFMYNAWVVPLRAIFPYQTKENVHIWEYLDYFADVVYLIDIIAFKSHRKFLREGFWIKEPSETRKSYIKTLQFKIDLAALFPADIIVSLVYNNYPLLRVPRLLKVETFWELFQRFDTILASPHSARITKTIFYMLYSIHSNCCAYYAISLWEGIGTTTWTFDGIGNAYIRCFYFATKTATSIGKMPKPENEMEYLFMTFAWLSGVFVFAILIGQIRDIIATATKNQEEYRASTYAAISYLHRLGVPKSLQTKVKRWLSYTWQQQKTLDESKILDLLPHKMRTDVALNLHVETVSKVKLFQNCEVAFLRDLVVKLRSVIYLPGDFVCRKGEVGREMFIVKSGKIHVVGGPSGTQILATLGKGSVFGEIALLGIGGMNKRTADVRAAGFANLFVLHKEGLEEAIRDYPASQEIMKKKAKKLMKENIKKAKAAAEEIKESRVCSTSHLSRDSISELGEEVIIKNKSETPKLIETMMQIFPPESKIGRYLAVGSKAALDMDPWNKLESIDTTMTSYPPTPFIPGSPGHISLELDISIMTGDSSEKKFSPPPPSSNSSHKSDNSLSRRLKALNFEYETDAKSCSCSSADDLKAYLDTDDFECRKISDDVKEGTQIEKFLDSCLSQSNDISVTETRVRPSPRLSLQTHSLIECKNEDEKFRSNSVSEITKLSSREVLPVSFRPPLYPIVREAYPGVSLSSSEESEEHDNISEGCNKPRKEMTPRVAAIIASRFLTAVKPKTPVIRQPGVDSHQSTEYATEDCGSTFEYDTD